MKYDKIDHVMHFRTGKYYESKDLLKSKENGFKLRRKCQEAYHNNTKLFVCPVCKEAVCVRAGEKRVLHFAHYPGLSDSCELKTKKGISKNRLLAIKFNGQRESDEHIYLKDCINKILENVSCFSDIKVEKNYKGENKDYKRPDVQATTQVGKIVFEIQLSTTFLSVITERELFYRKYNTFIFWIFRRFKLNEDGFRFTESDVFYNNNLNAFVINKETIKKSIENKKFFLKVFHAIPVWSTSTRKIIRRIEEKEIEFSELTFNTENYSVYYFDYESKKQNVYSESFRNELFNELSKFKSVKWEYKDIDKFRDILNSYNISIEDYPTFLDIVFVIFSMKAKAIYGFALFNYRQLVFHLYDYRKNYAWLSEKALYFFSYYEPFCNKDTKGTFIKKLEQNKNIEKYHDLDHVLIMLFPGFDKLLNV